MPLRKSLDLLHEIAVIGLFLAVSSRAEMCGENAAVDGPLKPCFVTVPHNQSVNVCNRQTGSPRDEERVFVVLHCVAYNATSITWMVNGNEERADSGTHNRVAYSTLHHTITNDRDSEITVECEARKSLIDGSLQTINSNATISVKKCTCTTLVTEVTSHTPRDTSHMHTSVGNESELKTAGGTSTMNMSDPSGHTSTAGLSLRIVLPMITFLATVIIIIILFITLLRKRKSQRKRVDTDGGSSPQSPYNDAEIIEYDYEHESTLDPQSGTQTNASQTQTADGDVDMDVKQEGTKLRLRRSQRIKEQQSDKNRS